MGREGPLMEGKPGKVLLSELAERSGGMLLC